MKKGIIMTILMILALVFAASAVSATVAVTDTYSTSAPTWGDNAQQASNPNADDAADENIYVTTSDITLTNDAAAVTVSSISINTVSGFSTADLNITLETATPITVPANGSVDVSLKARIPEELDAVDDDLDESAFKVATITFLDGTGGVVATFDAFMQRENKLTISNLDIAIENDKNDYDDGDDVDESKPGDEVVVTLEAENEYDDRDDDVEIQDVEFTVEVDGDVDADENADLGDINADDKEEDSISFTVDEDADDDTYEMLVLLEGEDEHGAKHGESWELDFEVKRKAHEIIIKSATIADDQISCNRGGNSIQIRLTNIGRKDEDEVSIYVKNENLGLDYEQNGIEIDESDDFSKTVTFDVDDTLETGTYVIEAKVYYSGNENDGVLSDLKDMDLSISKCSIAQPTTTTDTNVQVTDSGDVQVAVPDNVLEEFGITETEEEPGFTDGPWFIVTLAAAVVVIFGLGTFLIVKFLVMKP